MTDKIEKIKVSYYGLEAERKINAVKNVQSALQNICDEFSKITKGKKPLKLEELKMMFVEDGYSERSRPNEEVIQNLILDRFVKGNEFGGLQVNREMFQIPSIEAISGAINNSIRGTVTYISEGYFFMKDGTVKLREGFAEDIKEEFTVWAATPEEIERYRLAEKLSDALNDISAGLPESPFFKTNLMFQGDLEAIVTFNDSGKFLPADTFVKTGKVRPNRSAFIGTPTIQSKPADNKEHDAYIANLMEETEA